MSAKVSLNKTASVWVGLLWICMMPIWGATIGKVVAIGGNASDIALDSSRKVLYIANFTANRIEVMSQDDGRIQTSINVAANPSSLALSPDGKYIAAATGRTLEAMAQSLSPAHSTGPAAHCLR